MTAPRHVQRLIDAPVGAVFADQSGDQWTRTVTGATLRFCCSAPDWPPLDWSVGELLCSDVADDVGPFVQVEGERARDAMAGCDCLARARRVEADLLREYDAARERALTTGLAPSVAIRGAECDGARKVREALKDAGASETEVVT